MRLLMFKFKGYKAEWDGREGWFTLYEQTKVADFSFLCSICFSEPWQAGTALVFQMECGKFHINKSTQLIKVLSWAVKPSGKINKRSFVILPLRRVPLPPVVTPAFLTLFCVVSLSTNPHVRLLNQQMLLCEAEEFKPSWNSHTWRVFEHQFDLLKLPDVSVLVRIQLTWWSNSL